MIIDKELKKKKDKFISELKVLFNKHEKLLKKEIGEEPFLELFIVDHAWVRWTFNEFLEDVIVCDKN